MWVWVCVYVYVCVCGYVVVCKHKLHQPIDTCGVQEVYYNRPTGWGCAGGTWKVWLAKFPNILFA